MVEAARELKALGVETIFEKDNISTMNGDGELMLTVLRYLSYKNWEEIAGIMNYSWRNVHYVHSKALKAII